MSNNKQSSIELFIEQLEEKGNAWENVSIRRLNISIDVSDYMELKQQAKAMHKNEIMTTYKDGRLCIKPLEISLEDEYYNSTFGGNNEQQ